jgi:hypothetical protein
MDGLIHYISIKIKLTLKHAYYYFIKSEGSMIGALRYTATFITDNRNEQYGVINEGFMYNMFIPSRFPFNLEWRESNYTFSFFFIILLTI